MHDHSGPTVLPINRLDHPDPAVIAERYVDRCNPVIIRGATDLWPAMREWTQEWFRDRFSDRLVEVTVGPCLDHQLQPMTLRDLLTSEPGGGPQHYLRQYQLPGSLPELLHDFVMPIYIPHARQTIINLWLGPARTVQPFHKDNKNPLAPVHNFLVQIQGRKLVSLVSADQEAVMYRRPAGTPDANYSQVDYLDPNFEQFPRFREATIREAVVEPGEMILIPAGTWHHVLSLEASISLSFWWYQTRVADLVASVAGGRELAQTDRITDDDLAEFGGYAALAFALSTLPPDRRAMVSEARVRGAGVVRGTR